MPTEMPILFSPDCSALIRHEIRQAKNNEVFFIAQPDASGCLVSAEAVARGSKNAVPAIISRAASGEVVLHNHPSGDLTPSNADMDIASVVGNNGIGFAIINNQCDDCYLVVAPHVAKDFEPITTAELERAFGPEGMLARNLSGYEQRREQLSMATSVADAFNKNRVTLIEAGTGTGKSLAYLISALIWAVRNEQKVVISTNTINLQEQLIKKDIPLLQRNSTVSFNACLVKGRGNYICKRKLETVAAEPSLFPDAVSEELSAIFTWSEASQSGCLSDLSFHPSWEVWDDLRCEGDQCSRSRCSHFQKCFFYRARREASSAHLLVANHALLLADIALRRDSGYDAVAILPPFSRLIIDEGHHLEEAATGALSVRISRSGLMRQLSRLTPSGNRSGILNLISGKLGRDLPEHLDGLYHELAAIVEGALMPQTAELAGLLEREMDWLTLALQEPLAGDDLRGSDVRRRVTPFVRSTPFWHGLESRLRVLAEKLSELSAGLGALDRAAAKLPDPVRQALDSLLTDAFGIGLRLSSASGDLFSFCDNDEDSCRWLELKKTAKGSQAAVCIAPLELSGILKEALLDPIPTVVLTSATMTVGGSFGYQRRRTGLDLLEPARLSELSLPSPFNFAEQSLVGIPNDLPDPSTPAYRQALADAVLRAVALSNGGAFVLFTSFDLLKQTCNALKGDLERLGLTVLRQGEGGGRHQLLARFRKEHNAVLFGTDSFWEGVDVKGDALRLVIIARLPFHVPTEPIQQARAERVTEQGGDPFRELSIPQAVLKLRQGFGRLIRSRDDHGAVLILDSRIVSKNYGKRFLKSLPSSAQVIAPADEVFRQMDKFFGRFR